MARQYVINTGPATMAANTAKTLIEIPTGATMPINIRALEVMSRATAAGFLIVEFGVYTTTGTGTTVTPQKWGVDQSVALISGTVKILDTAEPAGFARGTLPGWSIAIPGMYSIIYPPDLVGYIPISTLRAIRVTSSLASPAELNLFIEQ